MQASLNMMKRLSLVKSPQEAQEMGITMVYQEVNLCTNLSIAENILIGREPMKWEALIRKQ